MKKLSLFALVAALSFLTGCITIIEKYTLNKDGSGTMEYFIDMSELYQMMASFSDSTGEMESPEIDQSMREMLPGLENIEGISNIELTGDTAKYAAGIKFDFKNPNALNQAMNVLFKGEKSGTDELKYIDINGKTFTRYSLTSADFNKEELLGSEELDAETMKSVLESMKYKIIINFSKPVKKVNTLVAYTIEENTVSMETNFSEIFDKKDFLKTIIKTK
jgi:hypothetical protein